MPDISRECIRDTLLAKRECREKLSGFIRQVYKMRANRYLDMQTLKRAAPVIVVVVRGGLVQEVRSTNPYTQIWIADYDTDGCDNDSLQQLSDAEERGIASDMYTIY